MSVLLFEGEKRSKANDRTGAHHGSNRPGGCSANAPGVRPACRSKAVWGP